MGWFKTLMGATGEGVAKPIDAMGNALDKVFTSDDEKLSHNEVMERIKQQPIIAQQFLDQLNAKSAFLLVQAARPYCIYVAGTNMLQLSVAIIWFGRADKIPQWYADASVTAFWAGLGIYTLARTVEKMTGKAK